jgi:ubiquinone/menaquinone biosynthesis C-methylase UbiE
MWQHGVSATGRAVEGWAGGMSEAPNAAQAERWTGESGLHWVANRERHHTSHLRLIPHLLHAAAIVPGDRVLDIGCGCGETTIMAARLAAGRPAPQMDGTSIEPAAARPGAREGHGSALGLDVSTTMLAEARRLAADACLPNIGFEHGDAQAHPLPPGAFDVAISSFGVIFFRDSVAAFSNVARALRPGGRLAFLCWQDDDRNEVFSLPARAIMAVAPLVGKAQDGLTASDLFTDPRQITAMLSSAGWSDISVEPVSEPARLGADAADVVDYVRGNRRVRSLLAEIDDPALAQTALAAVREAFRPHERPDGVWVTAAAWVVSATAVAGAPGGGGTAP